MQTARRYTEAFAADPRLAEQPDQGRRYNAACAAALAAAGQGEGAAELDAPERARLRRQALQWLRADLAVWAERARQPRPAAAAVKRALAQWRQDTDLAGVRDQPALAGLPDGERQDWHMLWADVDRLLK